MFEEKSVYAFRADITKDDLEAYALLEDLGNPAHSIPYLAIYCGNNPDKPRVLADLYTKEDVLEILNECPGPTKIQTAQAR